jgi:glycerol kinase
LAAAIVDQPAALLAEECFTQGSAKCTFGTGAFLLVNIGDKPKISKNGLATSLAWHITLKSTVSSAYYLDGQVFTAATAIAWLVDNQFITNANQIDSLPDADSVITAPGFAGYGAPLWKPNAKAAIAGLGLHHTKSHIARSVVNGIAAQVADLLTAITQDGVSVSTLKVDGGLTQSNTLMQMVADLAQIDVELYPHPDATAIGVANLATLAINPTLTLADLKPASKGAKNFSPKWSADQANNYLKQWRKLQLVTSDLT